MGLCGGNVGSFGLKFGRCGFVWVGLGRFVAWFG